MGKLRENTRAAVIVEFRAPAVGDASDADLARHKARVRSIQDAIINATIGPNVRVSRMEIVPMFAAYVSRAQLEALAADARVIKIYPNRLNRVNLLQSLPLIKQPFLKKEGGTGKGQIVAIVDTGVKAFHEFLKGKVIQGACFTNAGGAGGTAGSTCPNGTFAQTGKTAGEPCVGHADCVHGTHVAGIAAGRNTILITGEPKEGVAPQAKLLAINVFTVFSPTTLSAFDSDIIKGQEFVFANRNAFTGMKIASINMSLGNSVSNSTKCDASSPHTSIINQNRNANIATAIASGNNGFTNGVSAPGCVSTAITVGASDKSDNIASFSNMGSLVDVMAPGVSILSSVVSGSGYAFFNGTSMATPHIAGSVAALRTLHKTATVAQIQSALKLGPQIVDNRSGGTFTRRREDLRKAEEALAGVAIARTSAGPSQISVRAVGE
jgi:subtilisin family serine protease